MDTRAEHKDASRDVVGRYTLGNLQAMLLNWIAMSEVAICIANVVIPPLSAGIQCKSERLEHPAEYFIQHLSGCLPLLIQLLQRNIAVLHWNWQEIDHYDAVC